MSFFYRCGFLGILSAPSLQLLLL